MSADGIIAKLRRDFKYSISRLCTDSPQNRYVILKGKKFQQIIDLYFIF